MNTDSITDLTNILGASLEPLIAIGFTYFTSSDDVKMRNSLIVAGTSAFLYINKQRDKAKSNVLNYNIQ